MAKRTIHYLFAPGIVLSMMIMGGNVLAQPSAAEGGPQVQAPRAAQTRANAEGNPACQRIISECRRLGFIQGQWKKDNGLWKDCFDPVVRGGTPTRDGKPINVPVSASDIQSCRAAAHHR